MSDCIRIDLHMHSSCSDGLLTPGQLAMALAEAGVRYASLTDHDCLDGLADFSTACSQFGIVSIPGIELTALDGHREVHLLAHGIDLDSQDLRAALAGIQATRTPSMRKMPCERTLGIEEAIELIHRAGGIASLAHPHATEPDPKELLRFLGRLASAGLDGVESSADYSKDGAEHEFVAQCQSLGLVICLGSDFHGRGPAGPSCPGIDVSAAIWKKFRDAILKARTMPTTQPASREKTPPTEVFPHPPRPHWRSFIFRIILPAAIAIIISLAAFFWLVSSFNKVLLDRKRETIRELTQAACGILEAARQDASTGRINLKEAQDAAKKQIAAMRYGKDSKDYFWIQDLQARMIMHPYRSELEGSDMSSYRDPQGTAIFKVFSELARERREGYVDYVWQWMDNPNRMEPKESYIRLYEPWGWVIGTGLYLHDVNEEISRIKNALLQIFLFTAICVSALIIYLIRDTVRLERLRTQMAMKLWESNRRYRSLVQASTEGAFYANHGRLLYANPVALEMAACDENSLQLLELSDLFPCDSKVNQEFTNSLTDFSAQTQKAENIPCILARQNGQQISCMATLRRLPGDMEGMIVLLRRSIEESGSPSNFARSHSIELRKLLQIPAMDNCDDDLVGVIGRAGSAEEISAICSKSPLITHELLENGLPPGAICHMLASLTDAVVSRLAVLAIGNMTPPPVPFAFLALGSQGRHEQTLHTDQDTAMIYAAHQGKSDDNETKSYFLALGEKITQGLSGAGYLPCRGQVMASNPRWVLPMEEWKVQFEQWTSRADVRELMEFSIFFDFSPIFGEASLAHSLRQHVHSLLRNNLRFFPLAAQHALQFKPPRRIFGNLLASAPMSPRGHIDLKAASIPIVSLARLYSLRQGGHETNTIQRLESLSRSGVFLESKSREIITAYETLLRLRLRRQVLAIMEKKQPDNLLDTAMLGHIEKALLCECFREIDLLQAHVRQEFLAGEFGSF